MCRSIKNAQACGFGLGQPTLLIFFFYKSQATYRSLFYFLKRNLWDVACGADDTSLIMPSKSYFLKYFFTWKYNKIIIFFLFLISKQSKNIKKINLKINQKTSKAHDPSAQTNTTQKEKGW